MKRTCLHTITNTHENESCEFHPSIKKTKYFRMKISVLLLLLLVSVSISAQKLEKLWATHSELKTPESVLYSELYGLAFVACMGDVRDTKNSDGSIAQINLKGEILNAAWVTGLNDPKGMAIWEGKLYVADMDELVIIDIKSGSIDKKFLVPEAKFLNDVTVCKNGMVFVSDMRDQRIYAYSNNEFKSWLHDPKLDFVNGLWAEGGKLYVGNNSVWEIDIQTKELKELFTGTGGIDGLESIGNGNFIFSNWGGKIYVSDNGKVVKLLDTSEEKINTADLDFLPDSKLVLVPTFFGNNVEAYQLVW